jgi:chemotaxis protein histidine kinase CheA
VPELGEILRSVQQSLDQDPLSQSTSPPAYNFSQLRIHDDAEEGDQRRTEELDPATLGIRMATDVLRSLRGDPEDRSHRVQLQLARIDDPDLSSAVFAKLHVWLPSTEYSRVTGLVAKANSNASPLPLQSQLSPEPVEEPDPQGDQVARDDAAVSDATNRAQLQAERQPWDAQTHTEKTTAQAQKSVNAADTEQQKTAKKHAAERATDRSGQAAAASQQQDVLAAALRTRQTQAVTPQQGQQRMQAQKGRVGAAPMRQGAAVMPAVAPAAPVPQTGGAPAAPMTMSSSGTPPVDLNQVDALANAPDGPLARHQMREVPGNTAERQPVKAPPGEEPIGAENTDLPEIDVPEPALPALPAQQPTPAAAYLPTQDIDVSGVPTADQLKLPESGAPPPPPAAPSFPSPPPPAMVAPPPGKQDPVEAQLAAQAAREGATIEPAPGQVGPDAAETEPDVAPESVEAGPELMSAQAAAGPLGAAGPEGVTDDVAAGPDFVPDSGMPADAASAQADAVGPGADGGPGAAGPGTASAAAPDALPADASLEPGGGSCAGGPEPSAAAGSAGGGPVGGGPGGGGGGGSAAPPPQPPVPDVSQQQPQTALAVVGRLPVVPMARGLSGVNASVSNTVGKQKDALAKSPPELERPSGAPKTLHGPPKVAPPASYGTDKVQKATAKGPDQQAKPQGKQVVGGPTPADQVRAPKVTGNSKGNATTTDVQNVQQAVNNVPTTDPVLDHASVGVAPKVQLTGQADPALTDTQLTNLRDRGARILTVGRDDATRPLGEDQIYPDVPQHEILKASVPKGGAARPAGGAVVNSGPAGDQAVSTIAQQQHGSQIQSAIAQGQAKMTQGEQAQQRQEAQDRQQQHAKIAAAIKKSTDDETKERAKLAVQVRQQRKSWQDQEDKLTSDADTEAGQKHDQARSDIEKKKSDTDTAVDKRQQTDNARITAKRKEAEAKARSEQAKKQNQSGGWFGWVCSKVSEAFSALISVVKGIFDAARKFVQGVIDLYKSFVTGLIDLARKWIIAHILEFAAVLLAIGDVLLAAFPALRDKFRKLILRAVSDAIAWVNKIANFLKAAVTAFLNLLAKGLSALLDVLEKRLLAEIKMVESKIQGIINLVKNAIALLGEFAAIVKDVAADPGGWIRKLGSAIVNGIHYYLWDAIKTAVKNWFVGEIQQILGLGQVLQGGMQLLDVLKKGCITIGKIVQMAWQAMISALPSMLIQLVIEKLVAFLVPALGGIIQIVQGVIAAYNTISSIITAIGKFVAFLKDVKSGTAARPFAQAVAAGAVALINFVANWLLGKLESAAKGIGSKLKGIAQKILAFLKRGAPSVRKGIGTAFNLAKRGAKAAAGVIKRGFQAAGRLAKRGLAKVRTLAKRGLRYVVNGVKALGRRLAKTKFGKLLTSLYNKLKTKYQAFKSKLAEWRAKFKEWRENRKKNQPTPQERLEAAVERIRPKLESMLKHGVPGAIMRVTLRGMQIWYRLTELTIEGLAEFVIEAVLNPKTIVLNGVEIPSEPILLYIRDLEADIRAQAEERRQQRGRSLLNPSTATTASGVQRQSFEMYSGMDIATLAAEVEHESRSSGIGTQILKYLGKSPTEIWRSRRRSGYFTKKFRGEQTVTESGTYGASWRRILDSGDPRAFARASAQWPLGRGKSVAGVDPEEIAYLGTLSYLTEPDRNPGNMVFALLQRELYEQVGKPKPEDAEQLPGLLSDYFPQLTLAHAEVSDVTEATSMAFEGSSTVGRPMVKAIQNPGDLEQQIARLEARRQRSGRTKKSRRQRKLEDILNLGNREAQLLETFFETLHGIDLATYGQREVVLNRFYGMIEARLRKVFRWWNPRVQRPQI